MKRETWLFILGAVVAISIFGGLWLLLAAQPAIALAAPQESMSLAQAPFTVIILLSLAVLVSGGLLLAPFLQNKA